jgi:hypothetical protein
MALRKREGTGNRKWKDSLWKKLWTCPKTYYVMMMMMM